MIKPPPPIKNHQKTQINIHEYNVIYKRLIKGCIPLEDNTVDAVWCCLVLGGLASHVLKKSIMEIYRVLRPGGLIFLIENTSENAPKTNRTSWICRSVEEYRELFPNVNLIHLHDYYDLGQRCSIFAGRLKNKE